VLPTSGVAHVPRVPLGVAHHVSGDTAERISYLAGTPVPSSTSAKDSVAAVSLDATAKPSTVPGFPDATVVPAPTPDRAPNTAS